MKILSVLALVTSVLLLEACATAGSGEPIRPPNLPVQNDDYFQLVIEPQIRNPSRTETGTVGEPPTISARYDCRLRNPEGAHGVEGALRDFWINSQTHEARAGLNLSYTGPAGEVTHEIVIFQLKGENGGRKCDAHAALSHYSTPLFLVGANGGLVFTLHAVSASHDHFDDSVLSGAQIAVTGVAKWAGAPEPIAAQLGSAARVQLQNAAMHPTSDTAFTLGLAASQQPSASINLLDLNTRAGQLLIGANTRLLGIGSALYPMTDAVPDLSPHGIPPEDVVGWSIGNSGDLRARIPAVVDRITANGWSNYAVTGGQPETNPVTLNTRCDTVRTTLATSGGFSAADAAAIAWVMVRTQTPLSARNAMQRPACLTGSTTEAALARFGIVLPNPVPVPEADAGNYLRRGDRYATFLSTTDDPTRQRLARELFVDQPYPQVHDRVGRIFTRGDSTVPRPEDWHSYLTKQVTLQCLTIVAGDAFWDGTVALAVATLPDGTTAPLVAHFPDVVDAASIRIDRLSVWDDAERVYGGIRGKYPAGRCADGAAPAVVFAPTPAGSAPPPRQ